MATTATPHEVEHLQGRVRLYLLVFLVIDVCGYVSDLLTPLLDPSPGYPEWPLETTILRWAVTPFLVSGWVFARFAKPTRKTLVGLESAMTLLLVVAYVQIGLASFMGPLWAFGPPFALVGIVLLLVVRASPVPSPVFRTVAIGLASFVFLFLVADETLSALDPLLFDSMAFLSGAFIFATAATSHVIYGLRAQVRQAMRLGQYELGRKLGEGGMGVVYEATHVMLRRPTAVKLLPVEKAGEQTIARFEREVRQTSRLEHPNSVYIYDYGRTPDGRFYYAMEYLDGVTLEELVALDGPVGAARVASILGQAARALAEAHGMGLVHRDIKPANIMLCVRAGIPDTVKVLDFGLVKAVDNPTVDDKLTQAVKVRGVGVKSVTRAAAEGV